MGSIILLPLLGTGKTRTLVAAIVELVRSTQKSVLVCAQSNAACDEIAVRLLKELNPAEIFRMYAISYEKDKISESIQPISNIKDGNLKYPVLDYIYQFRVVICTLFSAGYFSRSLSDPKFDQEHFSHVIIDEAAATQETATLIPIAGVVTKKDIITAKIILSGDPKQLDASIHSPYAEKMGFKKSLLEHFFERTYYKRSAITRKFDKNFIVQLTSNYRCHPNILDVPNQLFYDNVLKARASSGM